jgi:hypothetical protein
MVVFMRARVLGALGLVGLLASLVGAANVTKWLVVGTATTVFSTDLDNLGNNLYTPLSPPYNNLPGGGQGDGALLCYVEGIFTFGAQPTAGTAILVWFLKTIDGGANYENTPSTTVSLGRLPDVVLPVTSGQVGTKVAVETKCPVGLFKVIAKNDGTGQALAASGNTIKLLPFTTQVVSP